jgi:hypothetical protein
VSNLTSHTKFTRAATGPYLESDESSPHFSNKILKPTKSIQQRPSWEANSHSASQEFTAFYWSRRFISVFTRARHWSLSWARWIQSSHTISPWDSFNFIPATTPISKKMRLEMVRNDKNVCFKVLFHNFPAQTEKYHRNSQSRLLISNP